MPSSPNTAKPQPWQALLDWLSASLRSYRLHAGPHRAAFRDVTQAENVLALASRVLPAYRRHHADLLAHLDDRDLFGPFFLVRVFEAILAQRAAGRRRGRRDRRPRPAQRFRRPSAHRHPGDPAAGRTLRSRTPSSVAPVPQGRGRGLWSLSRSHRPRPRHPQKHRSRPPHRGAVRSRFARRIGRRSARLRSRPSGQSPAQLRLRRMGSASSRQPGPIPPLCRPQDHPRRPAGAHRRRPVRRSPVDATSC